MTETIAESKPAPEFPLNEDFWPFRLPPDVEKFEDFRTAACIKIPFEGRLVNLKIHFSLNTVRSDGLELIPFHPVEGYLVDEEDLDLEQRKAKLLRYGKEMDFNPDAPLNLSINLEAEDLAKVGMANISRYGDVQHLGNSGLLICSLACIVSANGYYMSRGSRNKELPDQESDYYYFSDYFPLDTGPLAADSWGTVYVDNQIHVGEGHPLFFAQNSDDIRAIEVRFTLDPIFIKNVVGSQADLITA